MPKKQDNLPRERKTIVKVCTKQDPVFIVHFIRYEDVRFKIMRIWKDWVEEFPGVGGEVIYIQHPRPKWVWELLYYAALNVRTYG